MVKIKMFGLIKGLGEEPLAPPLSVGAPVAAGLDLRSRLTVPLEELAMPPISTEMAHLERCAAKLAASPKPDASAAGRERPPVDVVGWRAGATGVEVEEISEEEFARHLALFGARAPG